MSAFAVRWIYVLRDDYVYNVRAHLPADWHETRWYLDRNGQPRLEINADGEARVFADYAWDGCTPKVALFDILLGTPDGVPNVHTERPKTYYASLLHDVLYQFLDCELPLSRAGADQVFLELMRRDQFLPAPLYYLAVRTFGGLFRHFTRWKRRYDGCCVTP